MNADYTGVEGTASRWSEESLGFIEACLIVYYFRGSPESFFFQQDLSTRSL
jgi:hypothetical protein